MTDQPAWLDEAKMFGPERCLRRCSECPDGKHHWLEHFTEPEPDEENDGPQDVAVRAYDAANGSGHAAFFWACRHCSAWATVAYVERLEDDCGVDDDSVK